MSEVAQTLNLITLAKGNPSGSAVPGTGLETLLVESKEDLTLEQALWLLVLDGELIIDLPFGDFRILKAGDCIHLEQGLKVSWQPLTAAVVVRQRG